MGGEGVGLASVATPVADDVAGKAFRGARHQGQADDSGGPAQQLVKGVVIGAFLLHVEGTGHAEHRGVHVEIALLTECLRDLGSGPLLVEAETERAAPAEELG